MPIRITGMNSGLDTESIISELVKAKSEQKEKLVKAQTKLQWKQDAWKELNSKVYSFYAKTLSNMRLKSDYYKKTTKVSDEKAVSVITGGKAVNGVQTLEVGKLAKTAYLTGGEVSLKDGTTGEVTSSTTLADLGIDVFELKIGNEELKIKEKDENGIITEKAIDGSTKISDIVAALKDKGYNANFDEKTKRFFISAKEIGAAGNFEITGASAKALGLVGLDVNTKAEYEKYCEYDAASKTYVLKAEYEKYMLSADDMRELKLVDGRYEVDDNFTFANDDEKEKAQARAAELNKGLAQGINEAVLNNAKNRLNESSYGATKIHGQDAEITLNGAKFTSNTNTFEINGLTITANKVTDGEITLTTADDTEGIYDMIKGFLKEYNELINEMDKLYNADSSKGYEPLTDEEKEAMSEKEVEKWEEKIKNSILRNDSKLSSVASAMKLVMSQGVDYIVKKIDADGKEYDDIVGHGYLNDFGIGTLGYFNSKENEKNAYHIDGDPDDFNTMSKADKLKTAIANDPEKVVEFFSSLSMNLYTKLGDLMKKTDYSSSFTLYDDVAMKNEYNDYKDKISKQEERIADFEDRYYKKFSAMETALAKLQSKESAISGLFGM